MEKGIYLFSQYSYHESVEETGLLEDAEKMLQIMATKEQLLKLFEEAKLDPDLVDILRLYFNLANERTPDESPTPEGLEYLGMMCLEIYKLLTKETTASKDLLLFRLFVRLNFNKNQIITYYNDKIDSLMENMPENKDLIDSYLTEIKYLPKKNTAYTTENHRLDKEIKKHIKVVMNHYKRKNAQTDSMNNTKYSQLPWLFTNNENIAVIMYLLKLLFNIGVIENHIPLKKLFAVLSELVRRKDGTNYSPNTLRARYNSIDDSIMDRANVLLNEALACIAYDKRVYFKKIHK